MPTSNKHLPKILRVGRPIRRPLARLSLTTSAPGDTARMQAHAIPVVAPQGIRGYSAAFGGVLEGHNPTKYDRYA